MVSDRHTTALSSEATRIVRESFVAESPVTLQAILRDDWGEDVDVWLNDCVSEGIFRVVRSRPKRELSQPEEVRAGEAIRLRAFEGRHDFTAEYSGTLTRSNVAGTTVYWYEAAVDLLNSRETLGFGHVSGATTTTPVTAALQARSLPGSVGARCGVCRVCGGCGACGACGLCGGVDFASAALAIVAVDAALTLTNAASTFEMLRAQG
jgi:hypothetical protein